MGGLTSFPFCGDFQCGSVMATKGSLDIARAGCKGIAGLSPDSLAPRGVYLTNK
jgi:hypothetical protein